MWGYIIFGVVAIAVAVWGALKLVPAKYVSGRMDHHFAKKLEQFKADLARVTEAETHNYQRLIRDFDLFTTKRHEVYPELFKQLRTADWHIRGLIGYATEYSFDDFNASDVAAYLEAKKLPQGKTAQILAIWNRSRQEAIPEIRAYARMSDIQRARHEFSNARSYFLVSAIYLSDAVSGKADKLLEHLNSYLIDVEHSGSGGHAVQFTESRETNIVSAITELKDCIRTELSIGDYNRPAEPTHPTA